MCAAQAASSCTDRQAESPRYSAATLHEAAGQIGVLPPQIKPLDPGFRLWGPAFPVHCAGGNNLRLHQAIYAAPPKSVLVATTQHEYEYGYWGEVLSVAAQARGLAGLVLDGCVRDRDAIVDLNFPVFSRGLCIRGTAKDDTAAAGPGQPVAFGDVSVHQGDLVAGDADGVVVVPQHDVVRALAASRDREAKEALIMSRLRAGERSVDIFGIA